jgi:transcriptional regulator with XRE-family HTH domain
MRNEAKRSRPRGSEFVGSPSELGALLADLRTAKGLSLREVEEATGKAVSNAYLSQLENGRIKKPSPNVLHSLSEVYSVPYEVLMEKAGYLLPSADGDGRRKSRKRLAAFAIDDLTAEEEEELLKYLAFLRSRRPA